VRKAGISVTLSNVEPEVQFLAGFPTSPTTAISRPEVLAIPRRVPKTMSLLTEGGVPAAISEGGREMVEQLERKFGEAFFRGFTDELGKEAQLGWIKSLVGGGAKIAPRPIPPLQAAVKSRLKTRLEGVKPVIAQPRPIKGPEPGAEFAHFEPSIRRIERARGRTAVPAY